jgi:hypothetical protein
VLVNREWEQHYPKVRIMALTTVGSNHNPILVDDAAEDVKVKREGLFLNQHDYLMLILKRN